VSAAELAAEATTAIRNLARAATRAGNSAAAEAYWAAADLVADTFNIKGEPA
jgi:phosphate uptake regulator